MREVLMRLSIVAAFLVATLGSSTLAQGKKEPLVAQVKNAIDRGVRYLKENQRPDGAGWRVSKIGWEAAPPWPRWHF